MNHIHSILESKMRETRDAFGVSQETSSWPQKKKKKTHQPPPHHFLNSNKIKCLPYILGKRFEKTKRVFRPLAWIWWIFMIFKEVKLFPNYLIFFLLLFLCLMRAQSNDYLRTKPKLSFLQNGQFGDLFFLRKIFVLETKILLKKGFCLFCLKFVFKQIFVFGIFCGKHKLFYQISDFFLFQKKKVSEKKNVPKKTKITKNKGRNLEKIWFSKTKGL